MSGRKAVNDSVARVLDKMADSLEADQPDGEMTNAARVGLICQFIPGEPDLFDEVFPVTPGLSPRRSRSEYAAELRRLAGGVR